MVLEILIEGRFYLEAGEDLNTSRQSLCGKRSLNTKCTKDPEVARRTEFYLIYYLRNI
jgi:hypothetical protein